MSVQIIVMASVKVSRWLLQVRRSEPRFTFAFAAFGTKRTYMHQGDWRVLNCDNIGDDDRKREGLELSIAFQNILHQGLTINIGAKEAEKAEEKV